MNVQEAYRVLGLPLDAKEEDIKKQWKKLAFKHHPDRNDGSSESEETLKNINQAYDILTKNNGNSNPFEGFPFGSGGFDPFSDFVNIFGGAFGGRNQQNSESNLDRFLREIKRPIAPNHLEVNVEISIEKLLNFTESTLKLRRFNVCPICNGLQLKLNSGNTCGVCGGTGVHTHRAGFMTTVISCNRCNGLGTIFDHCGNCDNGYISNDEDYVINPFSDDKLQLHHEVSGYGFPGKNGRENERGNLYVNMVVKPNNTFTIRLYNGVFYLSNSIPIEITFSNIINGGSIQFPVFKKENNITEWANTDIPNSISFNSAANITVNPNDLTFGFLVNGFGFDVNDKKLDYFLYFKINPNITVT